jgi:hypothetical protein
MLLELAPGAGRRRAPDALANRTRLKSATNPKTDGKSWLDSLTVPA